MNIILSGKQISLSPKQKETIETKLLRLEKYFKEDVNVRVTVSRRKDSAIVEVTIPVSKNVIRAEATDSDLYCAVDEVVSKLSKQLRKFKTKLKNRGTETIRFENIDDSSIENSKESLISRRKKFEFTPMSEEEAILQLELVGHDFFVFVNSDTDVINVIYKRKDGDYGIIEQE